MKSVDCQMQETGIYTLDNVRHNRRKKKEKMRQKKKTHLVFVISLTPFQLETIVK